VTAGAPETISVGLSAVPDSGTLPFTTAFWLTMSNLTAENRRAAGRIDVQPAAGNPISNWRAGWTNLAPLEVFSTNWSQNLPALGSLVGGNLFTFTGADVTPAPWNQPPYAPAGDTDSATVTVTGSAP
jgi:hypothetical protein